MLALMTLWKKQERPTSLSSLISTLRKGYRGGWGIWILLLALIFLSVLAGANFESSPRLYYAGEIADNDVIAYRDIQVEDPKATQARKKQVMSLQPPVYDLTMEPYNQLQTRIVDIFRALNSGASPLSEPVLQRLVEEVTPQVAEEILPELSQASVQSYIYRTLLPKIREQMLEGLVSDIRSARIGRGGYNLRNLDTGAELLRSDVRILPDVQSFLAELSAQVREAPELNPNSRRAINIFLAAVMTPNLTMNMKETKKRNAEVEATVAPVYFQIAKGEVILRKGARVGREQQIILQTLYNSAAAPIHWNVVAGALCFSIILSMGFFISPASKPGSALRCKDLILISVILFIFGACAKCAYLLGVQMHSPSLLNAIAVTYPVTGAVGVAAMVFAARRYCTTGLLLSFFCTLMFQEGIDLFLYYFIGAMLTTWLIMRAQNRQDVVWSLIPLSVSLMLIWVGKAFLFNIALNEWPIQVIAVLINALLTVIILFAFSPVLEMAFGYSTRFRLMELMSLEHPLMQEIMVSIPGTYHHSLVVANMVEAGAKAIGANSLLCKVAALYHDAGKINYPEYFIENQFGAPNKHDRLAPSMSALILLSHVKKGTELAEKFKLGEEITDIIRQHHGTRVMRYFYQKAINIGEKPLEADFSYPGPRPQSKEAAILMLADSVEASSRTLTDPTPARIKTHIDKIMRGIFAEGQLDESELTFKDLHYLSENFLRILTGIFHQRIAYPETRLKNAQQSQKGMQPDKSQQQEQGTAVTKKEQKEKDKSVTSEIGAPQGNGGGQKANPIPPAKSEIAAQANETRLPDSGQSDVSNNS